jgi:hypothetical protein
MMQFKQIFFYTLVFMLYACSDDKTPKLIEKNGISITLPGFVKEDELAEDAFIEYANRFRNFYIIAFEKKIENQSLDSIYTQNNRRITGSLEKFKLDTTRNEANELITKIVGNYKDEKEPIYYSMKYIFAGDKYYLLTIWTRSESRFKHNKETIKGIISSFKLKN